MAGELLDEVVPGAGAAGSFNSGIVTWHRRRGRVDNLDGVVHRAAFTALRTRQLASLLDRRAVALLVDAPAQLERHVAGTIHACGAFFDGDGWSADRELVELARFDVPGVGGTAPGQQHWSLFWRRRAGAAPAVAEGPRDLGAAADVGDGPGRYLLALPPAPVPRVLRVPVAAAGETWAAESAAGPPWVRLAGL